MANQVRLFERIAPTVGTLAALDAAPVPWRHPAGFKVLPDVQREMRRLVADASARAGASPAAGVVREVELLVSKHYMHAMWRYHGRRTLYLDPGTAALLLETPLPDHGDEWAATALRLPYQAFAIALPDARYHLQFPGDRRPPPVDTVLVAVDVLGEPGQHARELSILVASHGERTTAVVDDDNVLCSGIALDATPLGALRLRDLGAFEPLGEDLLRLVLGVCLYLNSEHPRVEPVPPAPTVNLAAVKNAAKRRRLEQRVSRECQLPLLWVGRGEWPSGQPLPAADPAGGSWRPVLRHMVRGHYKRQAHGPRREARKVIWVKPYPRGADYAEILRAQAALMPPARRRGTAERDKGAS